METQIFYIAQLAMIDDRLDELMEDYGDLPEQIKKKEVKLHEKKIIAEETELILNEIKSFISKAKVTLVELKTKEEKLAQQQFQVRNNKEFDAITNEINHLKTEHEKLSDKMRTEGIKQENLNRIYEDQVKQRKDAQTELDDKYDEVQKLAGDQNDELATLKSTRVEILGILTPKILRDYERVRTIHRDSAVRIRRNSCSGCFSAIPAQIIVENRNSLNDPFFCESCGRILIPEDLYVEDVY
jgi:predicted  nucleic acid-binding Zn-ribbon protein